jgi:hypothetical protein
MTSMDHPRTGTILVETVVARKKFAQLIRAENYDEKERFRVIAQALQAPFLLP